MRGNKSDIRGRAVQGACNHTPNRIIFIKICVNNTKHNIIGADLHYIIDELDIKFTCFAYNNKNCNKEPNNKTSKWI